MFNGNFQESREQTVTLEEMQDVISVRSVEALIRWLYTHAVKFEIRDIIDHISAAMELARLADKYDIAGIESQLAEYINRLIRSNEHDESLCLFGTTSWICSEHISSSTLLPLEHPVRTVLAQACVRDTLLGDYENLKEHTREFPGFAADLLHEVTEALTHVFHSVDTFSLKDPLTGNAEVVEFDP